MSKETILNFLGFLLFSIGFLAIFLSLIGMKLTYISWINSLFGNGGALLCHILMIVLGVVLIYIVRVSLKEKL